MRAPAPRIFFHLAPTTQPHHTQTLTSQLIPPSPQNSSQHPPSLPHMSLGRSKISYTTMAPPTYFSPTRTHSVKSSPMRPTSSYSVSSTIRRVTPSPDSLSEALRGNCALHSTPKPDRISAVMLPERPVTAGTLKPSIYLLIE